MKHIVVGRKRNALRLFSLGVELEQIERQLLDTGFRFGFGRGPSARTQFADFWLRSLFRSVFRDAVERVNVDVQDVTAFVCQPNGFLLFPVDFNLL